MASVFLINWKLKLCLRNSVFGPFGAKMWVQFGSKIARKAIFMPAISLPAHFSLKQRNFQYEFTKKCFASFDQSSRAIYLMWCLLLLYFQEFTSIILFIA